MVNNMITGMLCEDGDYLSAIRIILIIVNIIKVVLPIIIIGSAIIEIAKVITSNQEIKFDEHVSKLIKKIIAGIIVFFVPNILDGILILIQDESTNYHLCIEHANLDYIREAYNTQEQKLIDKARESLEMSHYQDAVYYLKKIKDSNKKAEFQKQLDEIKYYLDIISKINNMDKKEEYTPIKNEITSNVKDGTVQKKLLDLLEDKYKTLTTEEVAQVSGVGSLYKQEETDSLKVYIYKNNSYYVTHLWVKDAWSQLMKYDSPDYGKTLYRPSVLLEKAMTEDNLKQKLVVGFNASGFYLDGVYDTASVSAYKPYDKTSTGSLVITNGKVVRNAYQYAVKTWYIVGVDRNNKMHIYEDLATNDTEAKKKWADSVIGKIKNTYTFGGPLVKDGKVVESKSMPSPGSKLGRQAICQIDTNNFILITGTGLSWTELTNIMMQANCQTGMNLDGGGSIALLFKSKNSTTIEAISGNGRALAEVGYFKE